MQLVRGFKDILSQQEYNTVACDIYGVIHDGVKAYPYAKQALSELDNVLLLSNSTRLQDKLDRAMATKFDINNTNYREILSSGLLTKFFLKDLATYLHIGEVKEPVCLATTSNTKPMTPQQFGEAYLKTGKFFLAGDPEWQEPLYMPLSPTIQRVLNWENEDIDFVLLGSIRGVYPEQNIIDPFSEKSVREDYRPLLDQCLSKNIPIICANPDVFAPNGINEHDGSTRLLICPGYVGKMYEEMGGLVLYFGKPFKSIYDYLITKYNDKRIICVGDNVATDIKGATEAGLDVVMITGGVHYEELKGLSDEQLKDKIKKLCVENQSKEPTYVMPYFRY